MDIKFKDLKEQDAIMMNVNSSANYYYKALVRRVDHKLDFCELWEDSPNPEGFKKIIFLSKARFEEYVQSDRIVSALNRRVL